MSRKNFENGTVNSAVDNIMHRAEMGLQWVDDGPILFEALKDAAASNTKPEDMLQFLRFHIQRGIESYETKKAAKVAAEEY